MRILYVIPSLAVRNGGPSFSTYLTVRGLRETGIEADILTCQTPDSFGKEIAEESYIHKIRGGFAHSRDLKLFLLQNEYDIYHIQGVWTYLTATTAKMARALHKPYIITPRGMLYPQDLAKGRLKKSIFLKLSLMNDLQKGACIHATCRDEMEHVRNLGITAPVAVIPNPIDTSVEYPMKPKEKLRIGYLGRVHPRKNIERIIEAWSRLQIDDLNVELMIIGDGDKACLYFLKEMVRRLKLTNVVFTGFVEGEEKEKVLSTLSYLVLASDFENFGNSIAEALIRGIPVITSKGTPWMEVETHRCGWWIDNDMVTIARTLQEAILLPEEEYHQMGIRGQELMKQKYSSEIIAGNLQHLYQWILKEKNRPEFVYV